MTRYSLILLVFFIVSCLPRSPQQEAPLVCVEEGADRALFDVDEITYEFERLRDSSEEDILPSNFLLKFKACIKDSLKSQPMRNRKFAVHTFRDKKESESKIKNTLCENVEWGCIPVGTDNDGCFRWSERYNFALPAEQRWIEFKRVIAHRTGLSLIPMMINPWVSKPQILDIRPQFGNKDDYLTNDKTTFNLHRDRDDSHKIDELPIQKCKEEGNLDQAFRYLSVNEQKAFLWVGEVVFNPSRKIRPDSFDYKNIYKICDDLLSVEECDQSCDDDSLSTEECEQNRKLDRKGGFLNLNLQIPVQIFSDDKSGKLNPKLVPAGTRFEVTFYLLSEIGRNSSNGNGKTHYMFHRRVAPITTVATEKYINLDSALLHIPYETTEGTVTILLKVKSLGEKNMEPFFGVYDIQGSSIEELHGPAGGLPLRGSDAESQKKEIQKKYRDIFEKFHEENAYYKYKPTVGIDGFDYSEGLALELSRMRFARVKASGDSSTCESPVKRWVVYLGEVCLEDPSINQSLKNRPVTVTAQDMWISPRKEGRITVELDDKKPPEIIVDNRQTDNKGCIQFTYELSHKLYDVQKYFMKKLTFKTHDQEASEYVAINPWEYGFLTYQEFTQAYENWSDVYKKYNDCKSPDRPKDCLNIIKKAENELEQKLKDIEAQLASPLFSENVKSPVLRLNEYRSMIIEPSYNIEPSLDVQVVRNLQMFLQPTIVRQDSPGEGIRQIPRILPIGYYLIRFIIAKGPQETAEGKEIDYQSLFI